MRKQEKKDGDQQEKEFFEMQSNIFANELPFFKHNQEMVQHAILIQQGAQILCAKLRRFSPKETEEIAQPVKALISKNCFQPSTSPFDANVLLVKKQDGTWRFCIDYRA